MQRGTLQAMDIKITPEDSQGQIVWQSDNQNVLAVTRRRTCIGSWKRKSQSYS